MRCVYTAIWPRAMAKKTRTRFCCWFLGPFVGLLQAAAADDPNLSSALFESVEVTEFVPPSEEDIASAIEGKTRVKKGVELEGSSNVIKCGVVSLFGVLVGAVLLV